MDFDLLSKGASEDEVRFNQRINKLDRLEDFDEDESLSDPIKTSGKSGQCSALEALCIAMSGGGLRHSCVRSRTSQCSP